MNGHIAPLVRSGDYIEACALIWATAVEARCQWTGLCCGSGQWKYNISRKAVYAAIAVVAPCALMVAMEITRSVISFSFYVTFECFWSFSISDAMFVSFLVLLLLPRLLVVVMSVWVLLGRDNLKPTISAKVENISTNGLHNWTARLFYPGS